jgi:hypothetical protein
MLARRRERAGSRLERVRVDDLDFALSRLEVGLEIAYGRRFGYLDLQSRRRHPHRHEPLLPRVPSDETCNAPSSPGCSGVGLLRVASASVGYGFTHA